MNMQGCGSNEASNGVKTTIPEFTAHKINIETIVCDNYFESVPKSLITVHV